MADQNAAVPWYQSKVQITQIATLLSAVIALSPKLGTVLGLTTPAAIQTAVEAVFGGIAVFAPILGSIFRAKSTLQPLTLTQAGADAHATIAAAAAVTESSHAPIPPPHVSFSPPK